LKSTIAIFDLEVVYQEPRSVSPGGEGIAAIQKEISIYHQGLPDAQWIVHEVLAAEHDKATGRKVVVSGLNDPTSLVFYKGALYVGEQSRISRFTLGPDLQVTSKQVIVPDLPTGGNHTTHTVLVGSDGNLYVSIGSTCNVCIESDSHRAAVWVYHLDGSGGRLYARGLRNAVGMAINPWNKQIWVTNNGRDNMGDNTPPDTHRRLDWQLRKCE
jgi:glucose/arabinose dehydrogenase